MQGAGVVATRRGRDTLPLSTFPYLPQRKQSLREGVSGGARSYRKGAVGMRAGVVYNAGGN